MRDRDILCSADSNNETTWQEELVMLTWVNIYWLNLVTRNRATDKTADFNLKTAEWAIFN